MNQIKKLPDKYNSNEVERKLLTHWKRNKIYKFQESTNKQIFSIDTPPPTISASHLHTGHVMSYTQADIIARYKRMQGYNVFYPMGFDDNGVPTERHTEKIHNIQASKTKREDFIKLCLEETNKCSNEYRKLWDSTGISIDWSKSYSTINQLFQKISQKSFIKLIQQGAIYRKEEPFFWSTVPQTALSQNDLEDLEQVTYLNDIEFKIDSKPYVISTTRPELIGACVAIFAHPDDDRYKNLTNKKALVPIYEYEVPIIFDESVNKDFGTGLMMVCTWGDKEDVIKWRKYKLPIRQIINKDGSLNELAGKYSGMEVKKARKEVVKDLENLKILLNKKLLKNTVKVDDRYGNPIEFIHTKQWFINVTDIKQELIKISDEINWYPKWTKSRNQNWIKNLEWDWCISRQRFHGVPIPVWYSKDTGEVVLPEESDLPVDPRSGNIPKSILSKFSESDLIPDTDVLDTWATSGCTPFGITELINNTEQSAKSFPNSLHPQAIDNVTVWAFYYIVMSYYHHNTKPFDNVMTSGHGVDEQGKKISKRLGNFIDPYKIINDYGADALRYWSTGSKLGKNHRFDIKEIQKGKRTVNKIWNAMKFVSNNVSGSKIQSIKTTGLELEDRWILHSLKQTHDSISSYLEKYEYAKARNIIDDFFWNQFCDNYLEIIKHRAYEKNCQFVLYTCSYSILQLYAPIFPFITDYIYINMFQKDSISSIHVSKWGSEISNWSLTQKERNQMNKFLEEIAFIRKTKKEYQVKWTDLMEYKFKYITQTNLQCKLKKMCYLK